MNTNQRKKYLMKNTAIFAIGNFATKLIAFFFVPLYTHILSTSEFGTVDLVITISTVISSMLTLNISEAVMRFSLDKDADKSKILTIALNVLLGVAIVGLAIVPISKQIKILANYAWYFYFYTITLGASGVFLCYLRGSEKLLEFSIGNIVHSLAIALLNILFLVVFGLGVTGYFYAYILSNLITIIYSIIAGKIYKDFVNYKFDKDLCKKMLKFSIVLIPNSFMWWIMNSADRTIVAAYLGTAVSGIYAIAYKIPTLLTMVSNIFTQAWNYSAIKEKDSSDKTEYTNKVFGNLVVIVLLAGILMMALMKPFLKIYVEDAYYSAWRYTPFLIIGFVFMTFGTFLSSSYTVHKDSKGFLYSATVGAIISIILKLILVPVMGVQGAALSTGISYIAVFVYRVVDTRKYLVVNVLKKKYIILYAMLIITAITMFIEGVLGQVLLACEAVIAVGVFHKTLLMFINPLLKRLFPKKV